MMHHECQGILNVPHHIIQSAHCANVFADEDDVDPGSAGI